MKNSLSGLLKISIGVALLCSLSGTVLAHPLIITKEGKTEFVIALGNDATRMDRQAAAELQKYWKKISGIEIAVVEAGGKKTVPAVWIGSSGHADGCPAVIDWAKLGSDGFTLRTVAHTLVIAGGSGKGSLYGVYSLLEKYFGCRKFTPTVEVIPPSRTLTIPEIDETEIPVIRYRMQNIDDPSYEEWHKLGNRRDDWGLFVHTFRTLVPPETYFRDHPEYFSMAKSGRIPDAQLCLSNPDVLRLVEQRLGEMMNAKPEYRLWSVSQNDTFNPCMCDRCRALDSAEGSPSGSILTFVNAIADRFPDKTISTLAYSYSRRAPRTIVPRSNVNIVLCSIECNRSRPLADDSGSTSFVEDVRDWKKRTDNILLWDYVVNFRNVISPFPNLRVLQPNIRFFVENGIAEVFEQGMNDWHTEFAELRVYLLSKLLWDPFLNVDTVMNDFLRGYYGSAAPFLRRYIDEMHDALERSGEDLLIYGYPLPSENGYLAARMLDRYSVLFDSAETAVRDLPEYLSRVHTARLPLQFALLEQAKVYGTGKRGIFGQTASGRWQPREAMVALLDTFTLRCERSGVGRLSEGGTTPREYASATRAFLDSSMQTHLALFKPVKLSKPASKKYHNGEESALTDGMRGWNDYHMHWLGFEGEDMDATVDLGYVRPISSVSTGFLQDINSWIFMPLKVEYFVSFDGVAFRSVGEVLNTVPADSGGAIVAPFNVRCNDEKARYVRVRATGVKICPDWHKGAGGLAWIFADEIVVR